MVLPSNRLGLFSAVMPDVGPVPPPVQTSQAYHRTPFRMHDDVSDCVPDDLSDDVSDASAVDVSDDVSIS